jgi:uncharacterized protein (TIGR03000 family)
MTSKRIGWLGLLGTLGLFAAGASGGAAHAQFNGGIITRGGVFVPVPPNTPIGPAIITRNGVTVPIPPPNLSNYGIQTGLSNPPTIISPYLGGTVNPGFGGFGLGVGPVIGFGPVVGPGPVIGPGPFFYGVNPFFTAGFGGPLLGGYGYGLGTSAWGNPGTIRPFRLYPDNPPVLAQQPPQPPPPQVPTDPAPNEATFTNGQIRFEVPEKAEVFIDGVKLEQTGPSRYYTTAALNPGESRNVRVLIRWMERGQPQELQRVVSLSAGDRRSIVVFGR